MAFLQGLWLLSGTTWFDSLRIRDAGPRHSPLPRRLHGTCVVESSAQGKPSAVERVA
jgi:hypothetical protein